MTGSAGSTGQLGAITTQSRIVEALRGRIMSGELPTGARLRQVDLAEELGVSTTPLREAFRTLAEEGLLRIDSHRGAVVRTTTAAEQVEILELLRVNESDNLEHAIARMTPQHLAEAGAVHQSLRRERDPSRWALGNRDFHWALARASARPLALDILRRLLNQSALHIRTDIERSPARRKEALTEHDRLLAACTDGDISQARAVLWQHITTALDNVRAHVDD
jgi:DNA-binding GntR family transcriptional regulator